MNADIDKAVEKAKATIPSVDRILDEAATEIGISKLRREDILGNFAELVNKLEAAAARVYKSYEDKAFQSLAQYVTEVQRNAAGVSPIELAVEAARRLEFRAGQMRKARGGASFQKIVQKLLGLAGVRCEEPSKETRRILRRIDLVSPSAEVARKTPDKAIFLAVKRTLRERWKQVVPEQMKGARLYLVTINGECSAEKAKEIKDAGMVAYVPGSLKRQKHLQRKSWIRPLSELPLDIQSVIPK